MAENPIKVEKSEDKERSIRETRVRLDYHVPPDHPLAVQIPEGSGATSVDDDFPLFAALADGQVEDRFGEDAPAEERLPIRAADQENPDAQQQPASRKGK